VVEISVDCHPRLGGLVQLILWIQKWNAGCQAFARLDFQRRAHRPSGGKLPAPTSSEADAPALDGAHMLDVGGSGLIESSLRHFLLRRLRANQAAEIFFDNP
jgi:hypothetical protein